jgi:Rrf2 family protein
MRQKTPKSENNFVTQIEGSRAPSLPIMILSKGCIYGIQAAIYVASHSSWNTSSTMAGGQVAGTPAGTVSGSFETHEQSHRNFVPISLIAEKLGLSFHFLTKVLRQFTLAGIMESYRGPNGGVCLAKRPEDISLYEMIRAVDGIDLFTKCMLGPAVCQKNDGCPVHDSWVEIRERLTTMAHHTTLAVLSTRSIEHALHARPEQVTFGLGMPPTGAPPVVELTP